MRMAVVGGAHQTMFFATDAKNVKRLHESSRVGAAAAGAGYDKIQNECTSHSLAFAHFHLEIDYLHEDNHCVCK